MHLKQHHKRHGALSGASRKTIHCHRIHRAMQRKDRTIHHHENPFVTQPLTGSAMRLDYATSNESLETKHARTCSGSGSPSGTSAFTYSEVSVTEQRYNAPLVRGPRWAVSLLLASLSRVDTYAPYSIRHALYLKYIIRYTF